MFLKCFFVVCLWNCCTCCLAVRWVCSFQICPCILFCIWELLLLLVFPPVCFLLSTIRVVLFWVLLSVFMSWFQLFYDFSWVVSKCFWVVSKLFLSLLFELFLSFSWVFLSLFLRRRRKCFILPQMKGRRRKQFNLFWSQNKNKIVQMLKTLKIHKIDYTT